MTLIPAAALERVVHEAGAVHRLDRRAHLDDPVIAFDTTRKGHQAIGIRRRGAYPDALAIFGQQAVVEPLAAQIQSSVQH